MKPCPRFTDVLFHNLERIADYTMVLSVSCPLPKEQDTKNLKATINEKARSHVRAKRDPLSGEVRVWRMP
jgi:hypothetical protein